MLRVSMLWTYETRMPLKTIGKSKTLVATLSDTELEDDLENEDG